MKILPLPLGIFLAMVIIGSCGLSDISTPVFTIPYLNQQIELFSPFNNISSLSPVWYYTPAAILLSHTAETVLENRSPTHSVTVEIKLWDAEYVQHIQSFLSRKTKSSEVEIQPIPFKWVRLEYHKESDYAIKPAKSQWLSIRNFPQTVLLRIRCASLEICERIKRNIQKDSPADVANVQLAYAFEIPAPRTVSVCFEGHQILNTPTFSLISEQLAGYKYVYAEHADYYAFIYELITKSIESVANTGEFIDDEQINRLVMLLLPRFRHNMTSTAVFTEKMWKATYWTDNNERSDQQAQLLQEILGNGSNRQSDTMRGDNVTGELGIFGHSQPALQALVEPRSGDSGVQWDRRKSIRPMMLYCVNISKLDERKISNVTVRLSDDRAPYVANAVPLQSAKIFYTQKSAFSPAPVIPVTLPTSVFETFSNAASYVRYLSEPKGSVTWIVRDADTWCSINSTAFTTAIKNEENAACHHDTIMTNAFGEFSLSLPLKGSYSIIFEMTGYYPIAVRILELNLGIGMSFAEPLLFINKRFTGSGTVSGTVYSIPSSTYPDPKYGPLAEADLTFLSLDRKTVEKETITSKTTTTGTWKVDLSTGLYTFTISKSGYITAASTIAVLGGKEKSYGSFSVTPVMSDSSIRIVLCADANISFDLNLHVRGPINAGTSRAHVSWNSLNSSDNLMLQEVELSLKPYASTIIRKQLAGSYRVSVCDWTNRAISNSWVLANSKATVHIYRGSSLLATYFVPNRMGNTWDVVEINGTDLTTNNIMRSIVTDTYPPSFDSD